MMKPFKFLITIAFFYCSSLNAQNIDWLKSIGGTDDDRGTSLCIDSSGNVYTTGYFRGTVDFDPGPGLFNLTAIGHASHFIQKLDSNGNFIWAKSFGPTVINYFYSLVVKHIDIDRFGNIYTTGSFGGIVDFDPGPSIHYDSSIIGSNDVFVQKLDASGNFLWVKTFGGPGYDEAKELCFDQSGNIYTTGNCENNIDFDPSAGVFLGGNAGSSDIFIQKMDPLGNFVWAKRFGGGQLDFAQSIKYDNVGNIYTTGSFAATVDFDPGIGGQTEVSNGGDDFFIQKLDTNGTFVWVRTIGGIYRDNSYSIFLDDSLNIYTTGIFAGIVDFDPGPGTVSLSSNSSFGGGRTDNFILKLGPNGNYKWAKSYGGPFSNEQSYSIVVDRIGNVYTTGQFSGIVDFDPGPGVSIDTILRGEDIFIHKLDAQGNFVWVQTFNGVDRNGGLDIYVDKLDNIYATGYFSDSISFTPTSGNVTIINSNARKEDVFITKIKQNVVTNLLKKTINIDPIIEVFPNPTNGIIQINIDDDLKNVDIWITDINGKTVKNIQDFNSSNTRFDFNCPSGIYFLHINSPLKQSVVKIVKE